MSSKWLFDPVKPAHRALSSRTLLHIMAPKGAHLARLWLEAQKQAPGNGGDNWRIVTLILGIVFFFAGWMTMVADWYTSIQGVRIPASYLGLVAAEHLWKFPAIWWWPFAPAISFAQVVPKLVPGTRIMWYPATIYSGATNAAFFGYVFYTLFLSMGYEPNIAIIAGVSALVGLSLAVFSERVLLFGLLLIETAFKWDD